MFSDKATVLEILENYVSDATFQNIRINIVSIIGSVVLMILNYNKNIACECIDIVKSVCDLVTSV